MAIYIIQEGIADYNILYSFGAYPTKKKLKKAIIKLCGKEWIENCELHIVKVTLHN